MFQVSHESIIPELKSETELLVELTSEPVGLVQALQQYVEVVQRQLVIELFNCFTGSTNQEKLNDTLSEAGILIERESCLNLFPFILRLALLLEHFTLEVAVSLIDQALRNGRFEEVLKGLDEGVPLVGA